MWSGHVVSVVIEGRARPASTVLGSLRRSVVGKMQQAETIHQSVASRLARQAGRIALHAGHRESDAVKRAWTSVAIGSGTLIAATLLFAPALAFSGTASAAPERVSASDNLGLVEAFTPAVTDPRLAAALARRGMSVNSMNFTPAAGRNGQRSRRLQLSPHRAAPTDPVRSPAIEAMRSPITMITPSNYNLGMSIGWRRLAISGDVVESDSGVVPGRREAAQIGVSYRATRRLTGRVAVAAERTEGTERLIAPDETYSLDVGGAFSISRHVDLTAGARYRISRDRIDPIARDQRRDSQAVYIGTAFHF